MKFFTQILVVFLSLATTMACQPAHVITSLERGYPPEAKTYLVGEVIWLEVRVPLISGIEGWQAKFSEEIPNGFSSKSNGRDTIFTWIVPNDRITWFGTNGYTVQLTGAEYSKKMNIRITKQTSNVSQWIIGIIPK
jgi:hypothetical protein